MSTLIRNDVSSNDKLINPPVNSKKRKDKFKISDLMQYAWSLGLVQQKIIPPKIVYSKRKTENLKN